MRKTFAGISRIFREWLFLSKGGPFLTVNGALSEAGGIVKTKKRNLEIGREKE